MVNICHKWHLPRWVWCYAPCHHHFTPVSSCGSQSRRRICTISPSSAAGHHPAIYLSEISLVMSPRPCVIRIGGLRWPDAFSNLYAVRHSPCSRRTISPYCCSNWSAVNSWRPPAILRVVHDAELLDDIGDWWCGLRLTHIRIADITQRNVFSTRPAAG